MRSKNGKGELSSKAFELKINELEKSVDALLCLEPKTQSKSKPQRISAADHCGLLQDKLRSALLEVSIIDIPEQEKTKKNRRKPNEVDSF